MYPIIEEVVTVGDDPDLMRGMNYSKLIPVIINAVQELDKKIAELETIKAEIEELKKELHRYSN